jgi:hypothetical protein
MALAALTFCAPSTHAQREEPPGEIVELPGFDDRAEIVTLAPEVLDRLLAVAVEEQVELAGWPLMPGHREDVLLTRHDVYAPGAQIWELRGGRRQRLPRSRWVYLWGGAARDDRLRVVVSIDPHRRELAGMAFGPDGAFELKPVPPSWQPPPGSYVLGPRWVLQRVEADPGKDWRCADPQVPRGRSADALAAMVAADRMGAAAITSLHTATVAVDTDNQLMAGKFANDTAAATNYVASLFAQMNAIYQRDLLVRLVQGTTYLRTAPDPWTVNDAPPYSDDSNGQKLNELTSYWSANLASVPRALTLMLSGRGGGGAAGVAWVDALCSKAYGYAFSRVTTTGTAPNRSDLQVTAHEIGHVFGSPHTHCYNTLGLANPDNCFSGESFAGKACFAGTAQCPAPATYQGVSARGTLMSYCHLLAGCSAETVFHPTSISLLAPKIEAKTPPVAGGAACILPDTGGVPPAVELTGVSPPSGPTSGGTAVTLTGSGFAAGATVSFGGAAASSVVVQNAARITAVTPAHAAGTVAVTVTNPGAAADTLSPGFFYWPPLAASDFYTLAPCRLVDTRNAAGPRGGPALAGQALRSFPISGACGVPADAKAVAANVTVVSPAQAGHVGVYPGNSFALGTWVVSFSAGRTLGSLAVVTLATNGAGTVLVHNQSSGTVHVAIDVTGYFR